MSRRNQQGNDGGNIIMAGGDPSFVSAEKLKQVDVPVETLLGAANGALSGVIISAAVSSVVTVAQHEGPGGMFKAAAKNWTSKHGLGILAGTTALGALGGIVRYSRAARHNEWSNRHYAYLEQQHHPHFEPDAENKFTEKVTATRSETDPAVTR